MKISEKVEQRFQRLVMVVVLVVACVVGWNATSAYRTPKSPPRSGPRLKVGDRVVVATERRQLLAFERYTCSHCQKLKPELAKMVAEARAAGAAVGYRSVRELDGMERAFAEGAGFLPGEMAAHRIDQTDLNSVPVVMYLVDGTVRWFIIGSAVTDADWTAFRAALVSTKP